MSIDGSDVGQWTADELSEGINLATLSTTPQFEQTLRVKALNDERHSKNGELRFIAFTYYTSGLYATDIDLNDRDAVWAHLEVKLKDFEGNVYEDVIRERFEQYLEVYSDKERLEAELDNLHRQLYEANQPTSHIYRLQRN